VIILVRGTVYLIIDISGEFYFKVHHVELDSIPHVVHLQVEFTTSMVSPD